MRLFVTVVKAGVANGDVTARGEQPLLASRSRSFPARAGGGVNSARSRRPSGPPEPLCGRRYIYAQVQPVRRVRPDTTIVDRTWQIREGNPARSAIAIKAYSHARSVTAAPFVEPGQRFRRTDVRNPALTRGTRVLRTGIVPTTRVADSKAATLTHVRGRERAPVRSRWARRSGGVRSVGFLDTSSRTVRAGESGRIRWELDRGTTTWSWAIPSPYSGNKDIAVNRSSTSTSATAEPPSGSRPRRELATRDPASVGRGFARVLRIHLAAHRSRGDRRGRLAL